MRCSSCSRFVGLDFQDPEVESLEIDDEGTVTCSVRIVRCCTECGDELKEATLDFEYTPPPGSGIEAHVGKGHTLEIGEDGVDQIEEGGGRYAKSYFGAEVSFKITCSCDADKKERWSHESSASDKIAASAMDENE